MERQLQVTLTASLLLHSAVLFTVPAVVRLPLPTARKTDIHVTYDKAQLAEPATPHTFGGSPPAQLAVAPPAIPARDRLRPAPMADAALWDIGTVPGAVRQRPQLPEAIDLSKLTRLSSDSVAYVDYFRFLRERIRWAALRNYPQRNVEGEVYLAFTLTADGHVANAWIIEDRSTSDPGLRASSLESLRQAAPFPSFPGTLNRPQMTFRIVIVYELGQAR